MLFGIKKSQQRMTLSYSPAQIVRSQTMGNNLRQDQDQVRKTASVIEFQNPDISMSKSPTKKDLLSQSYE